jgi:hypothetical protein
MGTLIILVYNLDMTSSISPPDISKVERDPRFFVWLLILVFGIAYYWTLVENPAIQKPLQLIIFTTLMIIHVTLYCFVGIIVEKPKVIFWYIILQGALVFTISWMGNQLPLIFALYTARLGETVGMFKSSRWTILSSVFYLILAFINIHQLVDPATAGRELLGLAPLILFSLVFVILYRRQADARQQA